MEKYVEFVGSILVPLIGIFLGRYFLLTDRKQKAANEFVGEIEELIKRGEKIDQEKLDLIVKRIAFKHGIKIQYLENRMAEMMLLATSGDDDSDWRVTSSKLRASLLAMRYQSLTTTDYLGAISKIIIVIINYVFLSYFYINNPFSISPFMVSVSAVSTSFFNGIVLHETIRFIRNVRK